MQQLRPRLPSHPCLEGSQAPKPGPSWWEGYNSKSVHGIGRSVRQGPGPHGSQPRPLSRGSLPGNRAPLTLLQHLQLIPTFQTLGFGFSGDQHGGSGTLLQILFHSAPQVAHDPTSRLLEEVYRNWSGKSIPSRGIRRNRGLGSACTTEKSARQGAGWGAG